MLCSIVLYLQLLILLFCTHLISSENLIIYFYKKLLGKVTFVRECIVVELEVGCKNKD